MPHEKLIDLRMRRTHKSLQEAIIELISEKGFDAITVGDIAERAMINRATFYRHYQDKYDLVAKIFEETTNHLAKNIKPIYKDTHQGTIENPPEIWIQLFEHVAAHSQLYRAMLGKNGSSWFSAKMREHTIQLILEHERQKELQVGPWQQIDTGIPQELPLIQLSHVLLGTIIWWLENEKGATPKQMATGFHRFSFYGYLSARGYEITLPNKQHV